MTIRVINNAIKINNILRRGMFEAVRDACLYVEREAKNNVTNNGTVDSGLLRASISIDVDFSGSNPYARVGAEVDYAKYIEFGTGLYAENGQGRKTPWGYEGKDGRLIFTWGMKPKPFLRPAIENNLEAVKEIISSRIEGVMIEEGVSG